MHYGSHPGWIEVISGVMFAGKSEELIRRVRRAIIARRRVQVFKSHLDSRYTGLYSVSSGEPFGAMGELMAVAELVDKLQAICVVCGDPACRNQRLLNGKPARYDSPTIMVGGRESYEARCRHCHQVPRRDEDQTALL
jgi:thymidine kinase